MCSFFFLMPINHMDPTTPTLTTNTTTTMAAPSPELTCGFEGNSDIYGMGIRLGIYMQWLAALIAELASPADVEAAQAATTSYQLAMFSGLVLVTQNRSLGVRALEAFLILLFCFAGLWVGSVVPTARSFGVLSGMRRRLDHVMHSNHDNTTTTTSPFGGRPATTDPGPTKTSAPQLFRLLLACIVSAYGTWTLFVGLDRLPRTACRDEVAFFFAPVSLFGWFRHMFRAFFVVSLVASTVLLVVLVAQRGTAFAAALREWPPPLARAWAGGTAGPLEHGGGAAAVGASGRGAEEKASLAALLRQPLGGVVALSVFMVAIELTLAWNAVRDVYDCNAFGQLFPLVLGASNLAGVGRRAVKAMLTRKKSAKL